MSYPPVRGANDEAGPEGMPLRIASYGDLYYQAAHPGEPVPDEADALRTLREGLRRDIERGTEARLRDLATSPRA